MNGALIRFFIKNWKAVDDTKVRQSYGNLASSVGIVANIVLCIIKLFIGFVSGSIAIISDAINNLADAGSAVATFLSFKISGKAPDMDHPFGHGRAEYLFSIGLALIIMVVGSQFLFKSVERIITPSPVEFSLWSAILLIISIGGKGWLYTFYKAIGKRIDSIIIEATAADSLSDILITTVVLLGLIASVFVDLPIDGYLGVFVSFVIIKNGFEIFRDSTSSLVGREPSSELVINMAKKLRSYEGVCGIHDLLIHDYGPGNIFATVHVEVDAAVDIMVSHELIDRIERDILEDMGIKLTIHMDPLAKDEETLAMFEQASAAIQRLHPKYSIHDFRVVPSSGKTILVFDILIPYEEDRKPKEIEALAKNELKALGEEIDCIITVERSYTGNLDIHEAK